MPYAACRMLCCGRENEMLPWQGSDTKDAASQQCVPLVQLHSRRSGPDKYYQQPNKQGNSLCLLTSHTNAANIAGRCGSRGSMNRNQKMPGVHCRCKLPRAERGTPTAPPAQSGPRCENASPRQNAVFQSSSPLMTGPLENDDAAGLLVLTVYYTTPLQCTAP